MKTNYFYSQRNYPHPRTAIEAEILYQALYVHVQRLNTSLTKCQTRYCMEPRPSVDDCKVMRFLGAVIKPVHPCTGLIARFAQQNVLLLRTTDVRVGIEKKTLLKEKSSGGKKIGAERAVLHFVFFIVMVNKMQQFAKENCLLCGIAISGNAGKNLNNAIASFMKSSGKYLSKTDFLKLQKYLQMTHKVNAAKIVERIVENYDRFTGLKDNMKQLVE